MNNNTPNTNKDLSKANKTVAPTTTADLGQKKDSYKFGEIPVTETSFVQSQNPQPVYSQPLYYPQPQQPRRSFIKGCLRMGCNCRSCGCLIVFFIMASLCFSIFVLVAKPVGIWDRLVTFLNADLKAPTYQPVAVDISKADLNSQIQSVGDVTISISQDQLTSLLRDKSANFQNLVVEVMPGYLRFYWDIDQSIPTNPLKGLIEMKLDTDGKILISRIGLGRIGTPQFLNNLLTNVIYSLLNIGSNNKDSKYGFLSNIIPASTVTINSIEFQDKVIKINATVKVDLFN